MLDVEENATTVFEDSGDFKVSTYSFNVSANRRNRWTVASFHFRQRRLRDGQSTRKFYLCEVVESAKFRERNPGVFRKILQVSVRLRFG